MLREVKVCYRIIEKTEYFSKKTFLYGIFDLVNNKSKIGYWE